MKLNAHDLQQIAYAEYIMKHCGGDRMICNGDTLIQAQEDGYLWDEFLESLEPPPLEAGYEPAPLGHPECEVRNFEAAERAEFARLKEKYEGA